MRFGKIEIYNINLNISYLSRGNWGGAVYRALGGGNEPKEMTPAERQKVEQRRQDVMMKMIKETVGTIIALMPPKS